LVLAAILGAGTLVTLPSGPLLDRFRAKPILIAANIAGALGYATLAFVDRIYSNQDRHGEIRWRLEGDPSRPPRGPQR